jgi:hypothetical protein
MKRGSEILPEENYRLRKEDQFENNGQSNYSFGSKGKEKQLDSKMPDNFKIKEG